MGVGRKGGWRKGGEQRKIFSSIKTGKKRDESKLHIQNVGVNSGCLCINFQPLLFML